MQHIVMLMQAAIHLFEKAVSYKQQAENQTRIDEKITRKVFDDEIESYIYDLSAEKISTAVLHEKKGFVDVLLAFMKTSEDHAQYVIQSVDKSYHEVCGRSLLPMTHLHLLRTKFCVVDFPMW